VPKQHSLRAGLQVRSVHARRGRGDSSGTA
jgi:hypothetical protein